MLKKINLLAITAALLASGLAMAECAPPEDVAVPDGAKASETELSEGQEVIRGFMAANEKYRNCLDANLAELGDAATPEQKALNVQLFNESVDREQALVDQYNTQVRAFNEANP